jgi:hypothetical protein
MSFQRRSFTREELERARIESMKRYLLANSVEEDGPLETKCLVFTGSRNGDGYGQIYYGGRTQAVHCLAWRTEVGAIPPGKQINHHCDNPPCFKIEHLYCGDQTQNMTDMVQRGRCALTGRKLSEQQVLEVRERAARGENISTIAKDCGLSYSGVRFIVNGWVWKELGGPLQPFVDRIPSSQFVGVAFHKPSGKWQARVTVQGARYWLGYFADKFDAVRAYNNAVIKHNLNRPLNQIDESEVKCKPKQRSNADET